MSVPQNPLTQRTLADVAMPADGVSTLTYDSYGGLRDEIGGSALMLQAAQHLGVIPHPRQARKFIANPKAIKVDDFLMMRESRKNNLPEWARMDEPQQLWQDFIAAAGYERKSGVILNAVHKAYLLHAAQFENSNKRQCMRNPHFSFFADLEQLRFNVVQGAVNDQMELDRLQQEKCDLEDAWLDDTKAYEQCRKKISKLDKSFQRMNKFFETEAADNHACMVTEGYQELAHFAGALKLNRILSLILRDGIESGTIRKEWLQTELNLKPTDADEVIKDVNDYKTRIKRPLTIPSTSKIGGAGMKHLYEWMLDDRLNENMGVFNSRYEQTTRPDVPQLLLEMTAGIAQEAGITIELDMAPPKDLGRALEKHANEGDVYDLHRAALIVDSRADAIKALKAFFHDDCIITTALRDKEFDVTPGGYRGAIHLTICMTTGIGGQYPIELKIIERDFHNVQNNYVHDIYNWSRDIAENPANKGDLIMQGAANILNQYERQLFTIAAHNAGRAVDANILLNSRIPVSLAEKDKYALPKPEVVLSLAANEITEYLIAHNASERIPEALRFISGIHLQARQKPVGTLPIEEYGPEWKTAIDFRKQVLGYTTQKPEDPAWQKLFKWMPPISVFPQRGIASRQLPRVEPGGGG